MVRWLAIGSLLLLGAGRAEAAEILLDEPLRIGDLIVFPTRSDPKKYYYVPATARLARHENGKPQFSFLRWVENVRSASGEDDVREGVGGGIVHAVVQLGASDVVREEARSELTSLRPGATLEGAVVYNEGTFALVTSFTEENGELTRRLVGTGSAPILEGGKAAVSLYLTKLGTEILWESFNTATPDVSFLFDMELEGYRSPKQALLEADMDEVYRHESFSGDFGAAASADVSAAVPVDKVAAALGAPIPVPIDVGVGAHAGGVFQAKIDETFDDLRQDGAIRIEFVGDDADLKKIVDQAYASLREVIFKPTPGDVRPGRTSSRRVASRSDDMRAMMVEGERKDPGSQPQPQPESAGKPPSAAGPDKDEAEKIQDAINLKLAKGAGGSGDGKKKKKSDGGREKAEEEESGKDLAAQDGPKSDSQRKDAEQERDDRRVTAPKTPPGSPGCSGFAGAGGGGAGGGQSAGAIIQASVAVDLCATLQYEFREHRYRGTYRLDLRKYTASTVHVPFAENVGDLRRHLEDPAVFRSVNLDDPLYKQREIAASLNGVQLDDFGSFLNSVAVQLRKQHEGGTATIDEARIDRRLFNEKANEFKLLYGWKGDEDRDRWLEYDYRVLWSFAGGRQIETPWQPARFSVIPLDPPFVRRPIQIEASADYLAEAPAPVRSITVRIYYDFGGEERTRQITMRADRGDLSRRIELLVPADQLAYDYEVSWRLRGNRTLTTGRRTTAEGVLYVDELPTG